MTPTDELPPFETRLLAELTDVVEERRRAADAAPVHGGDSDVATLQPRRTRIAVATAGVAAAGVALAVAPGLVTGGGDPAYAIRELPGGVIEVTMDDLFRDGEALGAELREFGVDVDVVPVPSSPSAVGGVYSLEGPDQAAEPGFVWGPDGSDLSFTIDPERFRGSFVLHLSVAAEPGEEYLLAEEVFEPGEVLGGLHCALGEPVRADQLVPHLAALGLTAEWTTIVPDPGGDPGVSFGERVASVPDGEVVSGYAVDATTVRFEVRPDGVSFAGDEFAPRLSDVPCTPDQAAAWD